MWRTASTGDVGSITLSDRLAGDERGDVVELKI
jgi:hypothetical protein